METVISKKLRSKIGTYSLVAGAAISMLSSCKKDKEDTNDPNIKETDLNPDIVLNPGSNNFLSSSIDFNNDGVVDVVVETGNYTYTYYGQTSSNAYANIFSNSGGEVLGNVESETIFGYTYSFDVVTPLASGSSIGVSQVTWMQDAYLGFKGTYGGANYSVGQFIGADRYVGVRFQFAGNTHYAWLQLALSADCKVLTVKAYAYNSIPNTPIEAGKI
ncbi:MAG: hypothetical protein R2772_02575 [Chitinophagales bacterium]